jgi:hypothetical protein
VSDDDWDRDSNRTVDAALRECWAAMREAMELGDSMGLDALLGAEYTLTHMTGLVQSKREWLAAIDADDMRYHQIDDVEIAVAALGPAPVVTVRTMTEATIFGFTGTWPLQLRTAYRPQAGGWVATDTVATTW